MERGRGEGSIKGREERNEWREDGEKEEINKCRKEGSTKEREGGEKSQRESDEQIEETRNCPSYGKQSFQIMYVFIIYYYIYTQ